MVLDEGAQFPRFLFESQVAAVGVGEVADLVVDDEDLASDGMADVPHVWTASMYPGY